jgi:AcrR family transcriptional regulator
MSMSSTVKPLRADARRNYEAIVRAAVSEVAERGATASLEDIARIAGVGSATLHRHFPGRTALMQAVFKDRIELLCERAAALAASVEPAEALHTWLTELAVFSASTRGLADTLDLSATADSDPTMHSCEIMLLGAANDLRGVAVETGAIAPSITAHDLLALVNAISLESRNHAEPETFATHLLEIALKGVAA